MSRPSVDKARAEYARMIQLDRIGFESEAKLPPSRTEVREAFTAFAKDILVLHQKLTVQDAVIGYLMEKFSIKAEDIKAYVDRKQAEYEAAAKADAEKKEAETPGEEKSVLFSDTPATPPVPKDGKPLIVEI